MKRLIPYKSLSFLTLIGLFLFILILAFFNPTPIVLSWDTIGYHAYLVELFVDGDLKIDDLSYYESIINQYGNAGSLYQFVPTDIGGFITKYSSGWAILNAPFLGVGHLFAGLLDYPQDGFSYPYEVATWVASLFYTLVGLIFMRLVLLHFFTEKLTSFLLVVLVLGTNYLHMNYSCIGVSHVYIFPFYALLIWLTIQFYKLPRINISIGIGLCLGVLMLIRPTEVLAGLIPIVYGITSIQSLRDRLVKIFTTKHYYVAFAIMLSVYLIQIAYWKYTTNEFLFYSYTNSAEGLDFNRPYLLEVMFSFRKGWFIYTPIMLLIGVGLVRVYHLKKEWFWPLLAFFVLNLYVVSCWTVWWYAGSFSQRALVHSYPVYIIIIGFAFSGLTINLKRIVLGFSIICIGLNLFQTWQIQNGILDFSRMSKEYYFSVFGQTTKPTAEQKKLLLIDRGLTEFENEEDYELSATIRGEINFPDTLSETKPYTPLIEVPYNQLTEKDHIWIKAFAQFESLDSIQSFEPNFTTHLCISMRYKGVNYAWRNKVFSKFMAKTELFEFDYLSPDLRTKMDTLSVGLWHQNGQKIKVNDLYFEVYEPR